MQFMPFGTNISVYEMHRRPKQRFHGISWDVYEKIPEYLGNQNPRILYPGIFQDLVPPDFYSWDFLISELSWDIPGPGYLFAISTAPTSTTLLQMLEK